MSEREMKIERSEPAYSGWFLRPPNYRGTEITGIIPRKFDTGAVYHYPTRLKEGPTGLIECSDGAVFTTDDIYGEWE